MVTQLASQMMMLSLIIIQLAYFFNPTKDSDSFNCAQGRCPGLELIDSAFKFDDRRFQVGVFE